MFRPCRTFNTHLKFTTIRTPHHIEASEAVGDEDPHAEGRDVVLYGFGRIGRLLVRPEHLFTSLHFAFAHISTFHVPLSDAAACREGWGGPQNAGQSHRSQKERKAWLRSLETRQVSALLSAIPVALLLKHLLSSTCLPLLDIYTEEILIVPRPSVYHWQLAEP